VLPNLMQSQQKLNIHKLRVNLAEDKIVFLGFSFMTSVSSYLKEE
jgi:hypothetical protein